jgi:asparagine synthase (glutamine-hydrolysing)
MFFNEVNLLKLQPAGHYQARKIADGTLIYHDGPLPGGLSSFDEALRSIMWREHLQPFACAMVDPHSNEMLLVRDHLGIAPLYYCYYLGKTLIFGETIPAILAQLPQTPALQEHQMEALFAEHKVYSDETFYQGIYRVEPGHIMHFKSNGSIAKIAYWQLEREGSELHYQKDSDYLEHFSELMTEALQNATANHQNIAAEFSAGLDSSAVYCAATQINIHPTLYMHIAQSGTKSAEVYNSSYEKSFVDHYSLSDICRVGADGFDPIEVFKEYATWFAGPAPYLFFMFADRLSRAVSAGKHPILLSGFGGDQGVSGQIPANFFMPELIRQRKYQEAWRALSSKPVSLTAPVQWTKKAIHYAQYMHPALYELVMTLRQWKKRANNGFRHAAGKQSLLVHPYVKNSYTSVREAEWFLLQGPLSHEVRMRIEYSSIVSRKMGFEYRYPLLYPKLLEFILSVPYTQKRREGAGRYLIRRYLAQCLPGDIFSTYRKEEGLGIVPSTFDYYQKQVEAGRYAQEFSDLPYAHLIKHPYQPMEMRNYIKGFMLK